MNAKLNLWERETGLKWKEYIPEQVKKHGAWYEMRLGTKYFKNPDYKEGGLVDITVGKNPSTAPTILTMELVKKEKFLIENISREYIEKRWGDYSKNQIIIDLDKIYPGEVSRKSLVTVLEFNFP